MGALNIGYLKVDQHAAVPDEGGRANLSPEDIRNSKNKRKQREKVNNKLAIKEQAEAANLNESGAKKTDQVVLARFVNTSKPNSKGDSMDLTIKGLKVDQGGGAGSRGGKVIGRTKSGKPIYQSHGHPSHTGFSAGEHEEASDLHGRLRDKASTKVLAIANTGVGDAALQKNKKFKESERERDHHSNASGKHFNSALTEARKELKKGKPSGPRTTRTGPQDPPKKGPLNP